LGQPRSGEIEAPVLMEASTSRLRRYAQPERLFLAIGDVLFAKRDAAKC
jgi:hypothetical protein